MASTTSPLVRAAPRRAIVRSSIRQTRGVATANLANFRVPTVNNEPNVRV